MVVAPIAAGLSSRWRHQSISGSLAVDLRGMNPTTVNCLGTQCGTEHAEEALAGPLALFPDTSPLNPAQSAYTHLVRLLAATFSALSLS